MFENFQHYLKQSGVYTKFKHLPNQVFVTKENNNKINARLISMVNDENMKVTDDGFYSTENIEENNLNDKTKALENCWKREVNTDFENSIFKKNWKFRWLKEQNHHQKYFWDMIFIHHHLKQQC